MQQLNLFDMPIQPAKQTEKTSAVKASQSKKKDVKAITPHQANKSTYDENMKILQRYKMNCKNKGLTAKSIAGICDNDLRLFIEFIGDKHLADVKHTDVEDFLIHFQEERKNDPNTLSRKFASLNQFFKTLIIQESIPMVRNPLDKLSKPKGRKKIRPHLTYDEYQQVLAYLDERKDWRGGALFSLFFSSGCRLSEITQQDRDSIDLGKRQFKVLGKGEKERICMLSKDAKERIEKYLNSRKDDIEALFISKLKLRWSNRAVERYVKATVERVGIKKKITPHCLRHTRAMYLLSQGVELEVIQRLLGHENIATTQIYCRLEFNTVHSKVDAIDDI